MIRKHHQSISIKNHATCSLWKWHNRKVATALFWCKRVFKECKKVVISLAKFEMTKRPTKIWNDCVLQMVWNDKKRVNKFSEGQKNQKNSISFIIRKNILIHKTEKIPSVEKCTKPEWLCATQNLKWLCTKKDLKWLCATENLKWPCATENLKWPCATENLKSMCATENLKWLCATVILKWLC